MTDDKPHEYVPAEWRDWPGDWKERAGQAERERDTAQLELREVKAERSQAQHDATERLIERNNLTEALRQVNARLVEVTSERDALAVNFAAAVKSLKIYSGAREDDRR